MAAVLEVDDLHVNYGPVAALKGVSLTVDYGEIVAVLGANGAGKTTLLRAISGLVRSRSGEVRFAGSRITGWKPHAIARAGVAQVLAGRGILGRMTVLENLRLGAYCRRDKAAAKADIQMFLDRFPALAVSYSRPASLLSGGQQQILAVARAWIAQPKLILLDEPSLGLAPKLIVDVFRMIRESSTDCSILLIEQNTQEALALASRGYVVRLGSVVMSGPCQELATSTDLVSAYIGEKVHRR